MYNFKLKILFINIFFDLMCCSCVEKFNAVKQRKKIRIFPGPAILEKEIRIQNFKL